MNVLALRTLPARARPPAPADRRIARVEIIEDMACAETSWRALERDDSLGTPYQRYDFLKLWQRHLGAPAGITPFVVVGFNVAGEPLFLWPLGRRRVGGVQVAEFLGGKHANFNLGVWRRDVAEAVEADDLRAVLARLASHVDVLRLIHQPLTWAGTTNPFALLPHMWAANYGFSGALIPDYDALLRAHTNYATRKKMRKKERALTGFGTVRFAQAESDQEVRRALEVFFKQKSARMRVLGVADAFAPAAVRRFIEAAAIEGLAGGAPVIELYTLSVDDIIVATLGGIGGAGRFSAMFNSIIKDCYSAESPGEQLLARVVRHCCESGLHTFDLGIGEANYKTLFCPDTEPLFESQLPLSRAGRLLVVWYGIAARCRRTIKGHATLWAAARLFRRLRAHLLAAI
jgi:CelD/BcsL family acetyltransferase involved in cellulose biosynthesis